MMYKANFRVNNGTRLQKPITGTSKTEVRNRIRRMALAELFQGNEGMFTVWYDDDNSFRRCVYYAEISRNGKVYYISDAIGSIL